MAELGTRRDAKREETRRRIFNAALEVFREEGVLNARVDAIVARAGVSRGSFYFHFGTKEHVLALAYAEAEARLRAVVDALPEPTTLPDVLLAVVGHLAAEWQHDPRLFVPVALHALASVAGGQTAAVAGSLREALARRFAVAAARGELQSAMPADVLSDIFLLNTFTALLAWTNDPDLPVEPLLHAVLALFLEGAAGRAPGLERNG